MGENANLKIAGVDEVGRGPLAGPVVAAAVVLPENFHHPEITDSKKISKSKRILLAQEIKSKALSWSIVAVGHRRVDQMNIREATKLAMRLSLNRVEADYALIDGNMTIDNTIPNKAVVKGDSKHIQIAAASIIAKVYRDSLMRDLDTRYPGYSLGQHAGYPTKSHRAAIAAIGPSPIHRKSFKGVREYYQQTVSHAC